MLGLGMWEIIGIVAIIILLFGAAIIPRLMRGVGEGVREFKEVVREPEEDDSAESEQSRELPPSERTT